MYSYPKMKPNFLYTRNQLIINFNLTLYILCIPIPEKGILFIYKKKVRPKDSSKVLFSLLCNVLYLSRWDQILFTSI